MSFKSYFLPGGLSQVMTSYVKMHLCIWRLDAMILVKGRNNCLLIVHKPKR